MIKHSKGNLLEADVEALVNTVNCVGVMGKGIALQFKQAYPSNFREYHRACKRHEVRPGSMLVHDNGAATQPRYIINFPTKQHWREKSKIEYIEQGLICLVEEIGQRNIVSIAIPPLGCGNGGLDWNDVRPLIEQAFERLTHVNVLLYSPKSSPDSMSMRVAETRRNMTPGRAIVLLLIHEYAASHRITMLEIQKLAYFAQAAGEQLRLHYSKQMYGPYAENLNHTLQNMEGQFIRGYGDRVSRSSIVLMPGAAAAAEEFLHLNQESSARLERVTHLIEGFETPSKLELLATVHWVAHEIDARAKEDVERAIEEVRKWSERKATFRSTDIKKAWQRLRQEGWMEPSEPKRQVLFTDEKEKPLVHIEPQQLSLL